MQTSIRVQNQPLEGESLWNHQFCPCKEFLVATLNHCEEVSEGQQEILVFNRFLPALDVSTPSAKEDLEADEDGVQE